MVCLVLILYHEQDGSQIRPDIANRIESHFRRTRAYKYVLDEALLRSMSLVSDPTESCIDSYMSVAQTLRWRPREENSEAPACVYTAMHGVGFPFVSRLFADFGLLPVVPVEVQSLKPDPDFSTVTKPNPEESGALDLAIAKAKETNVSVVIANDPDADRLGAAVVDVESGSTRILTGNEIAALLADYLLLQQTPSDRAGIAMVRSTVSSRFLSSMGKREGFQVEETLTGFKWLSFGAANLAKDGKTCLLAYEEALGYMIGNGVRDKDGVSAAAVFAELAGYWAKQGGVLQRLATLNELYGNHLCNNGYLTLTDSSTPLESIFEVARAEGFPSVLGKSSVVSVRDLTKGTDTAQSDGRAVLPADPNTQFLTFTCKSPLATDGVDDMTISLRGSGTEPKVKYYSEIRVSGAETKWGDEVLLDACEAAIAAVLKPEANNLTR
jgi:phosphomannomutase